MQYSSMLWCLLELNYNHRIWIAEKEQMYQEEEARKILAEQGDRTLVVMFPPSVL